jgi:hypothetical protein
VKVVGVFVRFFVRRFTFILFPRLSDPSVDLVGLTHRYWMARDAGSSAVCHLWGVAFFATGDLSMNNWVVRSLGVRFFPTTMRAVFCE